MHMPFVMPFFSTSFMYVNTLCGTTHALSIAGKLIGNLPAAELVPGDLMYLRVGDKVGLVCHIGVFLHGGAGGDPGSGRVRLCVSFYHRNECGFMQGVFY